MNKPLLVLLFVSLAGGACSSSAPDQLAATDETVAATSSTSQAPAPTTEAPTTSTTEPQDDPGATFASVSDALMKRTSPLDVFCADMRLFQSGTVTDPDDSFALMDKIIAGAPSEIASETAEFINTGRNVSEALAVYLPDVTDAEWNEFLAGLDDESIEYLEALQSTASTGELPDGSMGVVLKWHVRHCDGLATAWSDGFDVISVDVQLVDEDKFGSTPWPTSPSIETRISRTGQAVPQTAADESVLLCVDGAAFAALAESFGPSRAMLFESDGQLWEVTVVPADPFDSFQPVSCPVYN